MSWSKLCWVETLIRATAAHLAHILLLESHMSRLILKQNTCKPQGFSVKRAASFAIQEMRLWYTKLVFIKLSMIRFWKLLVFEELDRIIRTKMMKTDTGDFSCLDCSYITRSKSIMLNHVESRHVEYGGVVCQLCHKLLPTRQALRMHKSREHRQNMF